MKESLLHLVWEQQLFKTVDLLTTDEQTLKIHKKGILNHLQGPDFGNAVVEIGGQKWAGTIEIHVKSSDWYVHQHQEDINYQNVILHVVYEHDVEIFDKHSNSIPTLELKKQMDSDVLENYKLLIGNSKQWIFCESKLKDFDTFKLSGWLERLYVERLERKVGEIERVFLKTNKDWEAALFLLMAKYFGGNVNGEIFLNAFSQVDYTIVRKQIANKTTTSFLFGLVGLLAQKSVEDGYYELLKKEFTFQKQKHQLGNLQLARLNFYGCRPPNFPTIRLAQLIAFYEKHKTVFASILNLDGNLKSYHEFFTIKMETYWQLHYNFDKPSKKSSKQISKAFVNLLLMNVVVPMLFFYAKNQGKDTSFLLDLMYEIPVEKNSVISKFNQLGVKTNAALQTQALLTLKKEYCDKERCSECVVGIYLLKKRNNFKYP
ncbi:hypothetical protein FHR24_001004 [Wenyingzhuangia heitensis]|uniref:DUF2851 family protein n=1 Tax=Wenyingzhuangia heitensis TaxID=1487859 RepID=A0ABX0U6T3_9FLAO|nr:DUF2851 family protein [Wenyingzhuangia heitensis]NIJ44565.1 hypothetical protein [Wenyingzhuangia heitensis]